MVSAESTSVSSEQRTYLGFPAGFFLGSDVSKSGCSVVGAIAKDIVRGMPAGSLAASADQYWVPDDADRCWARCTLKVRRKDELIFAREDGTELTLAAPGGASARLQELDLVRPDQLVGVGDICSLRSVSEAAVLETLRARFARDEIYTAVCQGILLAVNPARAVPSVYSAEVQDQYVGAADVSALPPHVYRVAQAALLNLQRLDAKDQAVLISGESGAGKTESTKHILSFLVGPTSGADGHIFQKALSANVVLEAFGNATTIQNSNSSRFAKWLDIRASHAGPRLKVHGCQLTHYLLETARVCGHAPGERNFHVFYQLLQAPEELLTELRLQADSTMYNYLRPLSSAPVREPIGERRGTQAEPILGRCAARTDEVDTLRQALAAFSIEPALEKDIFRVLAGILHLGNCEFEPAEDGCKLLSEHPARCAAELLGVDPERLLDCLLTLTRQIGGDETKSPNSPAQARAMRDGLAQLLYGQLFKWLLQRMNGELVQDTRQQSIQLAPLEPAEQQSSPRYRSLGILDIAGFERFERNSLEQLLINLSNEYLQQSFNLHVFKSEQRDCLNEGIDVDTVNFADNQDCLDLIAGAYGGCSAERAPGAKAPGILDLLDEEAAVPRATEARFVAKITATFAPNPNIPFHEGHARFVKPRFTEASFAVKHFAGVVKYNCDGWLQKNSGKPPTKAVELVASSMCGLVKDLSSFLEHPEPQHNSRRGRRAQSASHVFRISLKALMERINDSNISFIRCIKPRANLQDHSCGLHAPKLLQQLHAGGIFEAIRIRQSGYSSRWPFAEFVSRYGCLAQAAGIESVRAGQQLRLEELVDGLLRLLSTQGYDDSDAKVLVIGQSKIFGKAAAAHFLEVQRARVLEDFAKLVQSSWRILQSRQQIAALAKAEEERVHSDRSPAQPQVLQHEELLDPSDRSSPVSSATAGRASPGATQDAAVPTRSASSTARAADVAEDRSPAEVQSSEDVAPRAVEGRSSTEEPSSERKERFALRRAMFEQSHRSPAGNGSSASSKPTTSRQPVSWRRNLSIAEFFERKSKPPATGPGRPLPRSLSRSDAQTQGSPPAWKVKILEALAEAAAKREIPALVAAIKRAEQAHIGKEQLQDARQALLEVRRAAAPNLLEEALRLEDIAKLVHAIGEGEAAGLDEQLLRDARHTLTRLQSEEALHHATEEMTQSENFPSVLVEKRKMAVLQDALDQGRTAGASDERLEAGKRALATAQARIDLREALRTRDRITVQEALQRGLAAGVEGPIVHDALTRMLGLAEEEARLSGDSEMLQVAIEQAEAAGPENPRCPLQDAIRQASKTLMRLWMASGNPDLIQRALEMGRYAGLSGEELASGMRLRMQLIAANATRDGPERASQSAHECAICFSEHEPTSVMSCCGREGSSLRVCTECLIRMGNCPFCRATL